MKKVVRSRGYLLTFLAVLCVEVHIACHVDDRLIRPYGGDALSVVLLYALVRAFRAGASPRTSLLGMRPSTRIALASLAALCAVELAQYAGMVDKLGLAQNVTARTVLGTSFDWFDLLAYSFGAGSIWVLEALKRRLFGRVSEGRGVRRPATRLTSCQ